MENKFFGAALAIILIFLPAILAVWSANSLAGVIEMPVRFMLAPLIESSQNLPPILQSVFAGNYGFLTMFPPLFV